jgi:hypothetical protein
MAEGPVPRILVMDTGPLITLAVADSLDYLLLPGLPIIVPDAVYFEATRKSTAIGAADIIEWTQTNADKVSIVPTHVFETEFAMIESGNMRVPDLGERAALEVIRYTPFVSEHEVAILLTEDDEVIRGRFISKDERHRIVVVTTRDLLESLEDSQLINSADAVYDLAKAGGRIASKNLTEKENRDRAKASLDAALKTNGSIK